MTIIGWVQIALYSVLIILFVKPFGAFMANVFEGERTFLSPVLRPVERSGLLVLRDRRERGSALADLCGLNAVLQHCWLCGALRAAATAGRYSPF